MLSGQSLQINEVRRKLNAMHSEFSNKNVLLVDGFSPSLLSCFLITFEAMPTKTKTSEPQDSVVRGTTSKEIIQMAREAGAKKVYFASCSPPIRHPNVYGIDMPVDEELIAHSKTEKEIAEELGVDKVIYLVCFSGLSLFFLSDYRNPFGSTQPLDGLMRACQKCNPKIKDFESSVFTGHYITGDVSERWVFFLDFNFLV